MNIETHQINQGKIAEVVSDATLVRTAEDGIDLLANLYYQDFDRIILHQNNIAPDFFDLKNGMAGEMLQKVSNFRVRLVIVGDFERYSSKSLQDFMRESNKGKQVNFVSNVAAALEKLSQ